MNKELLNKIFRVVQNPKTVFFALLLGIIMGLCFPENTVKSLAPWGKMVLSAIQMTVIPFVMVSIAGSVAGLVSARNSSLSLKRAGVVFLAFLLFESAFGIAAGFILQPGKLAPAEIATILEAAGSPPTREVKLTDLIDSTKSKSLLLFFTEAVPTNIFSALNTDNMLQIVIFAIMFGAALGVMPAANSKIIIPYLEVIQHAFLLIIDGICTVLPIAICFLVAEQVRVINVEILLTMIRFVGMAIGVIICMLIIASIMIWRRSGLSYMKSLTAMRFPIITTFATADSHVGLPSAIEAIVNKLNFSNEQISLIVPFGIATCRFGYICYFTFATMFLLQLYSYPIDFMGFILLWIGAILVGLKSSGTYGLLTIPMMSLFLDPLGVPLGGALALFLAVDLLIDPFRSLGIVYINSACAMLSANKPTVNTQP